VRAQKVPKSIRERISVHSATKKGATGFNGKTVLKRSLAEPRKVFAPYLGGKEAVQADKDFNSTLGRDSLCP